MIRSRLMKYAVSCADSTASADDREAVKLKKG